MVIQIYGHLIETQYIYKISEVKCTYNSNVLEEDYKYQIYGYFKIKFLNKKSVRIFKDGNKSYESMHESAYKEEEQLIKKSLTTVRDRLIGLWGNNQLSIPKIGSYEDKTT